MAPLEDKTPSSKSPLPPLPVRSRTRARLSRWIDSVAAIGTGVVAVGLLLLVLSLIIILVAGSRVTLAQYGIGFLVGPVWSPGVGYTGVYGAWPFLLGTLYTSGIALLVAVPVSLGIAIFLTELAPSWVRLPLGSLVDLLAAVPSVVYGFWAWAVLVPIMGKYVYPAIGELYPSGNVCYGTHFLGTGFLTAGVILAVMVIPTISALSREALSAVPQNQREAVLGLGATRWEATRLGAIKYARSGITGAVILGLGRAVGETMAVVMTIGNIDVTPQCLTSTASSMASVIANEFGESLANGLQDRSAVIEVGLMLLVITLIINVFARTLIWRLTRTVGT